MAFLALEEVVARTAVEAIVEHSAVEGVVAVEAVDAVADVVEAAEQVRAGGGTGDDDPLA